MAEQNEFGKNEMAEQVRKSELIALLKELSESGETFPFPGITSEAHEKLKAEDEEFPGMTTPIDEILEKCNQQGMKIVPGKYWEKSGNFFILPAGSNDIENDCILPKNLKITEGMDERVKKLIMLEYPR